MIRLGNIIKRYEDKTVLNGVNLHVEKGDYISIVGKSGAGKSTLMNIISTLDTKFSGEFAFEGKHLVKKELNRFRNEKVGFIFQQYNLIGNLTVYENVMLPYVYYAKKIGHFEEESNLLLEKFEMSSHKHQLVNTLSGGEQQRIALIRSIVLNPPLLLADEPTGNLDDENSRIIRQFLKQMNGEGKTIIIVTHDLNFAWEATRRYRIDNGRLYEY